jgi:hypothetical protein
MGRQQHRRKGKGRPLGRLAQPLPRRMMRDPTASPNGASPRGAAPLLGPQASSALRAARPACLRRCTDMALMPSF